jgi:hypothetical protein
MALPDLVAAISCDNKLQMRFAICFVGKHRSYTSKAILIGFHDKGAGRRIWAEHEWLLRTGCRRWHQRTREQAPGDMTSPVPREEW